jgi:hypothetical protein
MTKICKNILASAAPVIALSLFVRPALSANSRRTVLRPRPGLPNTSAPMCAKPATKTSTKMSLKQLHILRRRLRTDTVANLVTALDPLT